MISVGNSISGPSSNNDVETMMKYEILMNENQLNDRSPCSFSKRSHRYWMKNLTSNMPSLRTKKTKDVAN